ncbi:Uncharacterised protein [Mycobacteroides abscessus subsp. abscessus]|nr:Uncharacterised protein [Mycobacteroides abscessus subsp. abscessus]SIN15080.1 Uncharacterised protein [Mycobacteroides abscessus subsp. abscessus]
MSQFTSWMRTYNMNHEDDTTDATEDRRLRYIVWALLALAIALAVTAPLWANSIFASW